MTNIALLEGNLGRDPEVARNQAGSEWATLSVATTEGKDDNKKTEWHRVKVFGYGVAGVRGLKKGDRIMVRGKISYGEYEKNGQRQYSTDIIAYSIAKFERSAKDSVQKPMEQSVQEPDDLQIPF